MLTLREIASLTDSLSTVIKSHVAAAVGAVASRLADLESRINAIPAGPEGPPGPQGERGLNGIDGAPGTQGPAGADGRSAYEVAVSLGYEGDVYAWMDSLKGADGKDGAIGLQGERGVPGPPGPVGPSDYDLAVQAGFGGDFDAWVEGLRGPAGADGRDGIDGKSAYEVAIAKGFVGTELQWLEALRGKDGRDGRDGIGLPGPAGPEGRPGRDALALDILPALDESRAYSRGTFARHRGGLWHAFADTDGMKGWECVSDGVADVHVTQDDERTFTFLIERASGLKDGIKIKMPVMIYRDVFRADSDYDRGDVTTWAGSTWHCNAPCKGVKPGESDDWTLVVKKGRDGKDGQRGEKGDKGEKGKDGRDLTQLGPDGSKW